MKRVKNLENNIISTVSGGNIQPLGFAVIQDWELPILQVLHKVTEEELAKEKTVKKKK